MPELTDPQICGIDTAVVGETNALWVGALATDAAASGAQTNYHQHHREGDSFMKKALLHGAVLLSTFGASSLASAAFQIYSDRDAWHAAAFGTTELTQDFNSYTSDVSYGPAPVTAGFLTLSVVNGKSDDSWVIDAIPANFGTIPSVNGSTFATTATLNLGGFGSTQLGFAPIKALGFDYAGATYSGSDGKLTTSLGDSVIVAKSGNNNRAFVGVIYTAGETFTSLTWSTSAYFAAGIDNVTVFLPVPEPATAFLWFVGIAGLVAVQLKQRAPALSAQQHTG